MYAQRNDLIGEKTQVMHVKRLDLYTWKHMIYIGGKLPHSYLWKGKNSTYIREKRPTYILSEQTYFHLNKLWHTATHCNTLQHTATHCNTLQHTATHVKHCNTVCYLKRTYFLKNYNKLFSFSREKRPICGKNPIFFSPVRERRPISVQKCWLYVCRFAEK